MPYHAKYCFFQEDISFRGKLMCYSIGLGFSLNTKSPVPLFHQEKPRKGIRRKRKNKRAKKGSSWFPQRSWHYLFPLWNQRRRRRRRRRRKLRNWLKKEVNLKPPFFIHPPPLFQILWFREEAYSSTCVSLTFAHFQGEIYCKDEKTQPEESMQAELEPFNCRN